MQLYKASIWENDGWYYVNCIDDLAGQSGYWWIPARMMEITPAAYVEWLYENYHPDKMRFNGKMLQFCWSKENYAIANKFKLDINKIARNKKFLI